MTNKILLIAALLLVIANVVNAAPGDEDSDGVPNRYDQCPHTPPGVKILKLATVPEIGIRAPGVPVLAVGNPGCPEAGGILLHLPTIAFDDNTDRISLISEAELNLAVKLLRSNPGIRFQIELGDTLAGPDRSREIQRIRNLRDYFALREINPIRVQLPTETTATGPADHFAGIQLRVAE